jgi:hypothetical protein
LCGDVPRSLQISICRRHRGDLHGVLLKAC